jgi:hypothetical protein
MRDGFSPGLTKLLRVGKWAEFLAEYGSQGINAGALPDLLTEGRNELVTHQ